uniref:IS110 family transposase n=1 Tax=Paenibacillus alginolyticus TaxID=59839 RepID=UPI001FCBB25E|nr:IS110 family transposase [Paenibacillus alginolyticus]
MGIDIAKETHVAQVTNFRGIVLSKRQLTFSNTIEGFEKLERWIDEIRQKHRLKGLIIGMEPTGHYGYNLAKLACRQGQERCHGESGHHQTKTKRTGIILPRGILSLCSDYYSKLTRMSKQLY